ncbi:hypothetical protein [Nocardioides alcanivorans]|uniref:hypothetical protein n=1 Tax=Nocardioides alcanivorans TaxID=2897352 RepID=UPI001F394F0F|nr:hypothetical protein [Nocardioides alcanivorans]
MNPRTSSRMALAAAALLLLGACNGSSDDDAGDDATPDGRSTSETRLPVPDDAPFHQRAMAACTASVNSALSAEESPAIDVVTSILDKQEPSAEQLAQWHHGFDSRLDRLRAMQEILSALSSDKPEEQAAWEVVIDSGDQLITQTETRRDLLATGDWAKVSTGFLPGSTDADATDGSSPEGPSPAP